MTEPRTHDEFCFNTDLYQDDVEDYMCICNRLDDARRQERTDQQELTKAAVAEAEQRWADDPGPLAAHYAKGAADERAKHVNPDCVWGEGECTPNCPSCKRMDELIGERSAGYKEGRRDERAERMADASNGVGHWMHCPHCGFRHEITWAYNCGVYDATKRIRQAVEGLGQKHPKWDLMSTHYEDCWKHHSECALTLVLSIIDGSE